MIQVKINSKYIQLVSCSGMNYFYILRLYIYIFFGGYILKRTNKMVIILMIASVFFKFNLKEYI